MWKEWYEEYVHIEDEPRLLVRLEDLIFRADQVIPPICECVLGDDDDHNQTGSLGLRGQRKVVPQKRASSKFLHAQAAAKDHGGQGDLLRSLIQYGNSSRRRDGFTQTQWDAARAIIGTDLMETFGYHF